MYRAKGRFFLHRWKDKGSFIASSSITPRIYPGKSIALSGDSSAVHGGQSKKSKTFAPGDAALLPGFLLDTSGRIHLILRKITIKILSI